MHYKSKIRQKESYDTRKVTALLLSSWTLPGSSHLTPPISECGLSEISRGEPDNDRILEGKKTAILGAKLSGLSGDPDYRGPDNGGNTVL